MSGIAGIFCRDSKPVCSSQLEKIGKALSHRGPDGISYYCCDHIGLVHCIMYDTPESFFETPMQQKANDRQLSITFHGRIDNRQELCARVNWKKMLASTADSELVLAAYDKWSNRCVEYLLGDFAFAIWDGKEKKLFCARDHMGVKPFYYYLNEKCFVFASEIKGIIALPEIPRILNEVRVADYLTSIVVDRETTFFKEIQRLPPGNVLVVNKEKHFLAPYHEFGPAQLNCKTDSDYEEQFREIFTDAVRCRLRTAFPIGSELSGGLDSASIVCATAGFLANKISGTLQTFSGVFDQIQKCDERQYFLPIIERYGLISHQLSIDRINPSISYEKLMEDEDEPFMSPHIFMSMSLFPLMKDANIRVLLSGHDGDAAVSYGYNLLSKLALSGNIYQLIRCYRQSGVQSIASIIKRLLSLYWNILCKKIPISSSLSTERKNIIRSIKLLNPNFAKEVDILNRLIVAHQQLPTFGQAEQEYHQKNISQPIQGFALEFFERIAIKKGIIARYPYFDKRVIEFCLALPVCQKFRDGYNRSIVRRALASILPVEIRHRRTKTDFTPSLLNAFLNNDLGWLMSNLNNIDKPIYDYINKNWALSILNKFVDDQNRLRQLALGDLLSIMLLSRWMFKYFSEKIITNEVKNEN